jgi:cytoplasmic iron level regulating protein YaaA (DUF328/UPF0246 family)
VLIIAPPSESKRPPPDGAAPVDLGELSFPALTPRREEILAALIVTSQRPDAQRRLRLGPRLAGEVDRNVAVLAAPAGPASEVYAGALHDALGVTSLSPAGRRRAGAELVIVSSLWGAVRPADAIPAYRLDLHARLVGLDHLAAMWRTVLPDVLASAAESSAVVLDVRSPSYQAVGMADGLDDRTVTVRVVRHSDGSGLIGDVPAKRARGTLARHLLESHADPLSPGELASIAADRWPVEIEAPSRGRPTWLLTVGLPG